tara:strand:+ start:1329 stop:1808 length:480 start_codon:yes stop_codon:yes gene_type:complete
MFSTLVSSNRKKLLLILLALSGVISYYYYTMANLEYPIIIAKKSTFYTPGQHDNCKWVIHISDQVTTFAGDTSSAQIGIPEVIKDGYISGILQSGPGNSLLLAFSMPNQPQSSPPLILTSSYKIEDLPLNKMRFRVFNSSVLSMTLYPTYEECVQATMK